MSAASSSETTRRIIFLLVFLGVLIPLLFYIGFRIEPSENSQLVYDLIDSLPAGSTILLAFDYDPGSKAELQPMADAIVKHAFRKNLRIVCCALWPMGEKMCDEAFALNSTGKTYGVDWVNLGYKAGGMVTIQSMGRDFQAVFPTDTHGASSSQYPLVTQIGKSFKGISAVVSLSAGVPGIVEWMMITGDMHHIPTTGGVTAVSAPAMLPYVNEQRQLVGLLGGLKGAAEYELLARVPGTATQGMDAQSIAHLLIIGMILLANVRFWIAKKRDKAQGR
jgi:hypothetical protein